MSDEQTGAAPTSDPAPQTEAPQEDGSLLTSTAEPEAQTPQGEVQTETPDAKPEVPESYEFKAPEGMDLDTTAVEAFAPVAKELKLTQDQAQKLVDLYATQQKTMQDKMADTWKATVDGWKEAAKADAEIGGTKLAETLQAARRPLTKYGSQEFTKLLDDFGIGNHPEVIRFMARVGRAMSEDQFVTGGAPAGSSSLAQQMFPNMK